MIRISVSFFILILLIQNILFAQTTNNFEQINDDFQRGITLYSQSNFAEANRLFTIIIENKEMHPKTSAAYIFSAKCLFELQLLDEAGKVLSAFLNKFKGSNYYEEGLLLASKINIENKKYFGAAEYLLELLVNTNSASTRKEIKNTFENFAIRYLTSSEVKRIENKLSSKEFTPFLLYIKGSVFVKEGSLAEAEENLFEVIRSYPDSEEHQKSSELYAKLKNIPSIKETSSNIGVMLPLNLDRSGSPTNTTAFEVLEGIKFAVHEHNQNNFTKIGLLIRDTKRNQENIKQINNEFRGISNLVSVIGPLYSDEVKFAADVFNSTDIPIISPTATDNGLQGINKYFFQANPSFDMRGRVMAQYLIFVENKKSIAVFNREDGYSALLTQSFIQEFQRFGGNIVLQEVYSNANNDLSQNVSAINSVRTQIDGIYLPVSDIEDARKVLSALSNFNFNVSLYGNQDWFLVQGLEHFPDIVEKLTITSDYYIDFNSSETRETSVSFRKISGSEINRNFLYGYDAAKMLVDVINLGSKTKADVYNKLLSGLKSNGLHNDIYFDERKVNSYLNIIRYRNGVYELIDKFNAGK